MDNVIAEAGKGAITMRDLRRVAIAHDFTWIDKELADMIHCFDGDGDGKVSSCSLHSFCCEKGLKSMWLWAGTRTLSKCRGTF